MTASCVVRNDQAALARAPLSHRQTGAGGLIAALGAILALALVAVSCIAGQATTIRVFHQARFVLSGSPIPPGEGAPWKQVSLPHQWRDTDPHQAGLGWYRVTFKLDRVPVSAQALEVDAYRSVWVDFYVNGKIIGGIPRVASNRSVQGLNLPLFLDIPPALLRAGTNVVDVHMSTWGTVMNIEGLGRLRFGDFGLLRIRADKIRSWGYDAEAMFLSMAFTAGLIALFLWLVQRSDKVLFWYWFSCLSWVGAGVMQHVLRWADLAKPVLTMLANYRSYGLAVPAVILALRIATLRKPRIEFLLWAFLVMEGALPFLIGAHIVPGAGGLYFIPIVMGKDVINSLLLFGAAVVVAARMSRPAQWGEVVPAVSLALMGACMFFEAARTFGWVDIEATVLRPYHVPVLIVAIGAAIFDRQVRAIWQVQWNNVELQRRVDTRAREIEAFHAERAARTRQDALLKDRQRILSDMHDGLGASLISLLRYAQAGKPDALELEGRVSEALQELRIAIDALEPAEGDLAGVLGKLRYRLEPLLAPAGVQLSWDVGELPRIEALEPTTVFAIQRIVLEAVSNAVHHASPGRIRIAARAIDDKAIGITVQDDGRGFDPAGQSRGRGLENIRRRAAQIGAALKIDSTPGGGSTVALLLPLRVVEQAPASDPMVLESRPA
jgi:signal transduction histidine kinase